MKIIHLSTNDCVGGAARAAFRLHKGLNRIGLESQMLVEHKSSQDGAVCEVQASMQMLDRIKRRNRRWFIEKDLRAYSKTKLDSLELFSHSRSKFGSSIIEQVANADVINLHWVSGLLDYTEFFKSLPNDQPIIWTLHDMNPFTGGCHYTNGCELYTHHCVACPQLGSTKKTDLSFRIFKEKFSALRSSENLSIVSPSQWLAAKAKQSKLFCEKPVTVIPYGLDTEEFSPRDIVFSREILRVPEDSKVVLFLADDLTNYRKGMSFLYEALDRLAGDKKLFLITVGRGKPKTLHHVPMQHLGKIEDNRFLSMVYSAADVFVASSLQDNLPNTIIESMACGTPVVAFDTGGMPDMVRPGETGLLAEKGSAEDLAEKITKMLNDSQMRKFMGTKCRQVVLDEYQSERQAKRYLTLYESVL